MQDQPQRQPLPFPQLPTMPDGGPAPMVPAEALGIQRQGPVLILSNTDTNHTQQYNVGDKDAGFVMDTLQGANPGALGLRWWYGPNDISDFLWASWSSNPGSGIEADHPLVSVETAIQDPNGGPFVVNYTYGSNQQRAVDFGTGPAASAAGQAFQGIISSWLNVPAQEPGRVWVIPNRDLSASGWVHTGNGTMIGVQLNLQTV